MATIGAVLIPVLITKLWKIKVEDHCEISSIAINLFADFVILLLLDSIWSITLSTDEMAFFYPGQNSPLK